MRRADLAGLKFGRLTITVPAPDYVSKGNKRIARWFAVCECGNTTIPLYPADLRNGSVSSCGCLKRELVAAKNTTHGMTTSAKGSTYLTWKAMRQRCNDPNAEKYQTYGAVGITVDPAWDDFDQFVRDMGHRPPKMTLDRIENDKGYSKANCRWATAKEQAANRGVKSNRQR